MLTLDVSDIPLSDRNILRRDAAAGYFFVIDVFTFFPDYDIMVFNTNYGEVAWSTKDH